MAQRVRAISPALIVLLVIAALSCAPPALAAFPGSNGRIIARGEAGGEAGLISENTDGSERTLLAAYPFFPAYGLLANKFAQLSPDGSSVVFIGDHENKGEERAEVEAEAAGGEPASGEGPGLYVVSSHGGSAARRSAKWREGGCPVEVAWSPDGSEFVYARYPYIEDHGCQQSPELPAGSGDYDAEIVVGSGGAADRRIGWGLDPVWSSAGKIAYLTSEGIIVTDPTASSETRLETGPDNGVDWAPDASRLLFTTENTISSGFFNPALDSAELWTIKPDGTERMRVGTGSEAAVWSPDGKQLLSTLDFVTGGPRLVYFTANETEGCRAGVGPAGDTGAIDWGSGSGSEAEHNGGSCERDGEAEEDYGQSNEAAPQDTHCGLGKPVNCATGNESLSQTDLTVAGRGPSLTFTRYYNSQLARHQGEAGGPFGAGWTTPYQAYLTRSSTCEGGLVCRTDATVHQANGSAVRFIETESGYYPRQTLVQSTLTKEGEGYLYTLPNQRKLRFNGKGELTSESDRNGNALTIHRGLYDRVESISDAAGRELTFTYGEGGPEARVEAVTDPTGHTTLFSYKEGNLSSVIEPGEEAPRWKFKYDARHELTSVTDGRGHSTTSEYDEAGRVTREVDAMGRTRKWEYGTTEIGPLTKIQEPNGGVTVEQFNIRKLPRSVIHASGTSLESTTTFDYDSDDHMVASKDPNGHTTKYGYDEAGNRTSVEDSDGNLREWAYDSMRDVVSTTTAGKHTTTIERDEHGNAIKVSRPAPGGETQITKYKYAADGDLERVEDPLKRTTRYEYDSYGDRTAQIDPEGDKRTWAYDADSHVTSTVSPRGHVTGAKESKFTTSIERDAQERPVKVTDPQKHETKYKYDANGNLESETDAIANLTSYTYDSDDEPTKVKLPSGAITETGYDSEGQVITQIDAGKHSTKYVRDTLERITEVEDPLARKTLKEYDAAGNLTKLTDAAKRTTKYTYDPANRLTEADYSSEATPDVKYEYDADGNRTKMTDGTGSSEYAYDQLNRLTESKDGHGDGVKYEYDLANEPIKITYPSGKSVLRAYDKAGRLESVTDWLEHKTKFAFDANSDLTSTSFPESTGETDQYAYEADGAIESVAMKKGAETLASLEYTRNKDLQVTKATTKGLPGEEKPAFSYDENSRLSKGAGIKYEYDAANNPTKIGSTTYSYDVAGQLEKTPSTTYSFDELGERTGASSLAAGAFSYAYDQAGDLTSVKRPKFGELPLIEDSYGYDGDGLRASQTVSGSTTYTSWGLAGALPLLLSDGTSAFIYGPSGLPIEQISGEAVQYLHHDQQGSTRMITNAAGAVAGTTTFDAYGKKLGSTGSATSALGYDGQYTSADTGLIYLRARTYDPATTQFMSRDPLEPLTREPYGYASEDPINGVDRSGLSEETEPCAWPFCGPPPDPIAAGEEFGKGVAEGAVDTWHGIKRLWNEATADSEQGDGEETVVPQGCGVPFTPDQDALVKIAKEAKRNGLSSEDAEVLREWAEEYDISFRGPESHPGRGFGKNPHYRLGPVNHIPAK